MPAHLSSTSSSNLRGIAAMLLAVLVFAFMDAAMKQLGSHYSPLQVASLRGFSSLPFILLMVAIQHRWRELKPARVPLHFLRGILAITMLGLFVFSIRSLSLSSAYAIFLCGPLLVTALSVPFLKEHVDARRWVAIAIGLAGVIIMIRPTAADMVTLGALAAFTAAICYAFGAILIRVVARTESTLSMSFSFLLLVAVIAGALAWPSWTPVRNEHFIWIVLMGVTGALGQYFIVEAYRVAPAAVVAPFDYTALIWGAMLDWIFWRTLPDTRMVIGASVVVATGLYLIYRERDVSRQK